MDLSKLQEDTSVRRNNQGSSSASAVGSPASQQQYKKLEQTSKSRYFQFFSFNLDNLESEEALKSTIYHLATLIKNHQPEVVALQSVTTQSLNMIYELLQSFYQIYQAFAEDQESSEGDILLLHLEKVQVIEPYFYDYSKQSTSENRKMFCCRVELPKTFPNGQRFNFISSELEKSFDYENFRSLQYEALQNVALKHRNTLVAVSLNSYDDTLEPVNQIIQNSPLNDVWVNSGCSIPLKITCDFNNASVGQTKYDRFRRPDRILYRSKQNLFKPVSFSKYPLTSTGHRVIMAKFETTD